MFFLFYVSYDGFEMKISDDYKCKTTPRILMYTICRWSNEFKEDLRRSRIDTTKLLAEKIAAAPHPPEVFVGSSAVGKLVVIAFFASVYYIFV